RATAPLRLAIEDFLQGGHGTVFIYSTVAGCKRAGPVPCYAVDTIEQREVQLDVARIGRVDAGPERHAVQDRGERSADLELLLPRPARPDSDARGAIGVGNSRDGRDVLAPARVVEDERLDAFPSRRIELEVERIALVAGDLAVAQAAHRERPADGELLARNQRGVGLLAAQAAHRAPAGAECVVGVDAIAERIPAVTGAEARGVVCGVVAGAPAAGAGDAFGEA